MTYNPNRYYATPDRVESVTLDGTVVEVPLRRRGLGEWIVDTNPLRSIVDKDQVLDAVRSSSRFVERGGSAANFGHDLCYLVE